VGEVRTTLNPGDQRPSSVSINVGTASAGDEPIVGIGSAPVSWELEATVIEIQGM